MSLVREPIPIFQRRIRAGASFFIERTGKTAPPKKVRKFLTNPPPLFAETAPVEICHLAYNYILRKSSAADFPELINELKKRGIEQFENYGALVTQKRFRYRLAAKIIKLLKQTFPINFTSYCGGICCGSFTLIFTVDCSLKIAANISLAILFTTGDSSSLAAIFSTSSIDNSLPFHMP